MEIISAEARKIPVLVFARFRRARIGALRKELLEHFTAIFSILNDIILKKIKDSRKLKNKSESFTQTEMGIHKLAFRGLLLKKKHSDDSVQKLYRFIFRDLREVQRIMFME